MKKNSEITNEIFISAWNLGFRDKEIESAFQEMKTNYQNRVSLLSFTFLIIVSIVIWIQERDLATLRFLIFNILKIPFLLLFIFLRKKYSKKIEIIMISMMIPFFLVTIENEVNIDSAAFKSTAYHLTFNSYWNGCYNEVFTVIWIFLKVSWTRILALVGVINIIISFRYFDFETSLSTNMKPLQVSIFSLVFHVMFAYIIEKTDRIFFFEKKRKENSLSTFHNFIQKSLPLGIVVANSKEILYANKESHNLLQIEEGNLNIGDMRLFELEPINPDMSFLSHEPNSVVSIYNFLQQSFKAVKQSSSNLYSAKRIFVQKNFNNRKFLVKFNSIVWENEFAIIIVLSEDINAVKLEYLQNFELFKDRVLASISHQFRTPLNGVMGILENITENTSDYVLKESLGIALNSSKRLLSLINDILDFTQINSGRFSLNISRFSVDLLVKEINQTFESEANKKNVKFIIENGTNKDLQHLTSRNCFFNDRERLKQVISNILSNAFKFTTNGFVKMSYCLFSKNETEDDLNVKFTIEDSGRGIQENILKNLFELFGKIREGDYKNINTDGIGLGLAISQKLINALNGDLDELPLTVSSDVGNGSMFSFAIRSAPLDNRKSKSKESHDFSMIDEKKKWENSPKVLGGVVLQTICFETSADLIPKSKKKWKILAVDDDQINIMVIRNYFKNIQEIDYETASNGLEALKIIDEKANAEKYFDLILMDCNMPVMDGFEATERIIELIQNTKIPNIPIIAVTANILPSDLERCLKCGMVDYLTKPFSRIQLFEKLKKHQIVIGEG